MANTSYIRKLYSLVVGAALAGLLIFVWHRPAHAQQREGAPDPAATMQADVAHLKELVPPVSHPMIDVSYNASNLWFAGQKKNWPLAAYFLGETRNRMRWAIRLNPAPKGPTGEVVDMKATVDGIENGSFATLKQAIDNKNSAAFETAYKHMLEDCYSCHKAANRPYLRPMIPTAPPQTIINYDPAASWPQ